MGEGYEGLEEGGKDPVGGVTVNRTGTRRYE